MNCVLLSTTYFGPVQWYQKLHVYDRVLIEHHETFQKQTYRNRCLIATTQGVQALTVPVEHGPTMETCRVRLSDHGHWRHLHWQALQSAYGESPFFEYYEDDLRPFFTEDCWPLLTDYNEAICRKMCELLDIHPVIEHTTEFVQPKTPNSQLLTPHSSLLTPHSPDFRDAIRPKHPLPDPSFRAQPYYQVFARKHGFLPNLSILDLLFNMGPESIFYLGPA